MYKVIYDFLSHQEIEDLLSYWNTISEIKSLRTNNWDTTSPIISHIDIPDRNVRITGIQEDQFPQITQRIKQLFTDFLNQDVELELPHFLTEYQVGSYHAPHRDFIGKAWYREWVITIQLSDPSEYTGGDLKIGDEVLPKEKGCVIIYNGGLWHEVTKVTSGVRFSLTECAGKL